jgi:hypothetical protein
MKMSVRGGTRPYLRIILVCFVGTARPSGVVRVSGRTVIVLLLPVAWSLALESPFDYPQPMNITLQKEGLTALARIEPRGVPPTQWNAHHCFHKWR